MSLVFFEVVGLAEDLVFGTELKLNAIEYVVVDDNEDLWAW